MTATLNRPTADQPPAPAAGPERHPGPSRWTAWLAVLPFLAVTVISLFGAGTRELWEDEYATYHAITISWSDLGRLLIHQDLVHAAYYLMMRPWVAVAGDSLLAMRVPSIAALALTAAVTVLIGRRLVSTPVGVVAGLLLAVIPAVSRYAQEVRSYALVTMLATLSTYLLLRALERPTGRRWTLYVICTAFAGLVHFMAITVVGAQLLYVVLTTARTDETRRWRFAGAIGAIVLLVLPLPAAAQHQSSQVAWIKADAAAVRAMPSRIFLSDHLAYAVIALAFLGVLVLWLRHRAAVAMLLTWAAGPVVFGYVTFNMLHLFVARYMLFTLPAWALLAAATICYVGRPLGRHPHGVWWVLGAVLALPSIAYLGYPDQISVRESPVGGQPDYRSGFQYILRHTAPKDGIVYNVYNLGARSDLGRRAAEYEMRDGGPRDVLLSRTAAQTGYFGAKECPDPAPCLSGSNRLWLLTTTKSVQPWDGMPPLAAEILSKDFSIKDDKRYSNVRVVLLERRPTGRR